MKNALLALLFLIAGGLTPAAANSADPNPVEAKLIADTSAVVPGQSLKLGVRLQIAPGWHVYYKSPGDTGRATTVELTAPAGATAGALTWQKPYRFEEGGIKTYGYQNATTLVLPVQVPAGLKPGDKITFKVLVTWLACDKECVPGEEELTLELPVVASSAGATATNTGDFAAPAFTGGPDEVGPPPSTPTVPPVAPAVGSGWVAFLGALAAAFVGGMLLNLMPCVLPVLSLKIFGFVQQAGQDRKRIWRLGMAYAAGTMSTFLVLALVVIGVQVAGFSVGWGFQFQHPLFVIAMVTLITVMSLSLFGVFYVQLSGGSAIDKLAQREGYVGAFGKGVSATILSTPCTAPFLGSALGFAFAQPWWGVIAIFLTIGAGLSAPYLLLCWKPGWMKFLPKPGDWMERFKEAMGFLMLASAAWLLFVLGRQSGAELVSATVTFLLTVSASAWMIGRFADFNATGRRRLVVWILALLMAAGSFWYFVVPALNAENASLHTAQVVNGVKWEPYSEQALQKHLSEGKVVFVDFTADWCLTCKLNERVITGQVVADRMRKDNVVVLRADWTRGDPEITRQLTRFGRSGVPLYVVFSPKRPSQPQVLPELITTQTVLDALDSASK